MKKPLQENNKENLQYFQRVEMDIEYIKLVVVRLMQENEMMLKT